VVLLKNKSGAREPDAAAFYITTKLFVVSVSMTSYFYERNFSVNGHAHCAATLLISRPKLFEVQDLF
jgi:hypothetical protein